MSKDNRGMLLEGYTARAGRKITKKPVRESVEKSRKPSGKDPAKPPADTSNQESRDKK